MIVPAWAARSTCGTWASIGLDRSWTMRVIPCARAQQRLSRAPVCVLQVLSATPDQPSSRPSSDEPPVVCALVHEQRLARRDAVHVDPMGFEVVGERLLHVEQHAVEPRVLVEQPVEDRVDVSGLADRAVEVGGEPVDALLDGDPADLEQAVVVPVGVVAAELDLEALEAVLADPVAKQDRVAVLRLGPGQVPRIDRVLAADQVPGGDRLRPGMDEELIGEPPLEGDRGPLGRA